MKIVRISKRYSRKISKDWQSWEFSAEYSADVDSDKEDITQASDTLFQLAFSSVMSDIDHVKHLIKPKEVSSTQKEDK